MTRILLDKKGRVIKNVDGIGAINEPNLIPENIKKDINILGVTGSYEIIPQEKTITPSTNAQVVTPDEGFTCLSKVNVEPVTSAIDSNIIPENIKKDVSILGVTGTLESGGSGEPTKSWFYPTEYDSDGYPIKAKTIGCRGRMPMLYMYGAYDYNYKNVIAQKLQEFEINEGVNSIEAYAFYYCQNLKSIVIPNSIGEINDHAFLATNITSINIKSIESWNKISFSNNANPIRYAKKLYLNGELVTNLILPSSITKLNINVFEGLESLISIDLNNVTTIEWSALKNCKNLPSIVLAKVTSIGSYAFNGCSSCLLFDFRGATQVSTLSNVNAFSNTSADKKIVVPDALYDSWITATNWSSTTNNIVSSIIKASEYEASL